MTDLGPHALDLFPVVRVVPHDLKLEIKQIDLVLSLEYGHLGS